MPPQWPDSKLRITLWSNRHTLYLVDETYIKVGKTCKYLYRAVEQEGRLRRVK